MAIGIGICDDEEFQVKLNKLHIEEIAKRNNWEVECYSFECGSQVLDYVKDNHLDFVFRYCFAGGVRNTRRSPDSRTISEFACDFRDRT